ncbi:uncharacterized protein PgNI_02670 [Pyricularia grisea]|uniref:Uncharacterized protein n=1 Tax=Pyricularia grisea TaxID=148305 RepID=A0A6P8BE66_PYRGI|nr:uncharacterized protein PgNI_02670 [Pyricularia grisea]TLD14118.1 hypothetical protein PgNI_02670 [Pyricularia grisea]
MASIRRNCRSGYELIQIYGSKSILKTTKDMIMPNLADLPLI